MIVFFTDFGLPYTGQMRAAVRRAGWPGDMVDLFTDLPAHEPRAAAYLLAAYAADFPTESVFLSVVDPGVGGRRKPLALLVDGRWYVGPDNGIFEILIRQASGGAKAWEITWRPEILSASFHGRDLFAPVAAEIAKGNSPEGIPLDIAEIRRPDWPDDLAEIIYFDGFGNAMTGIRAMNCAGEAVMAVGATEFPRAETFSDVSSGQAFWYENANGLVEVSVNKGRAEGLPGLEVGAEVTILKG